MTCFYPLSAFQKDDGSIVFAERGAIKRSLQLPCGQCVGCRLERSRIWAVRVMHEASMYDHNYFVTLTYDDERLPSPPSLVYRHFQLFMKRLRKVRPGVRFYMCGEYGETTMRPHYHAVLFNLPLNDLKIYSDSKGNQLYTSELLDSVWQKGFVTVGALTFDSAAYVSRYCMKKVTGKAADDHYSRLDLDTGEVFQLEPEFNRMSLKPGIARPWIEKYKDDVFNHDTLVVNGRKTRPGRYYDRYHDSVDPLGFEQIKYTRYLKSLELQDDSPERLDVRANVARARLKLKQRSL